MNDLLEIKLGHVVGDLECHLPFDMGPGVDDVDLLKLTASRLDIEEVAQYQTDKVKQREEEIKAPSTLVSEKRREHDHGEVADPVGAGRRCGTHCTGTEGIDLRRIDPGQWQKSECKERDEEEDTNGSTLGVLLIFLDQASKCDDKAEPLAQETDQVQVATADPFNHEKGWDGGKGINGSEDTTHDHRQVCIHAQVILEKQRRVVDGGVTAGELLEELAGATNEKALEFLGLAECENRRPARFRGLGGFHIRLHEVEVGKDSIGVRSGVLELSENFAGLPVISVLHKPPRGIREYQGTGGHDQSEEDLERYGESPLDGIRGVGETEDHPVGNKGTDSDHCTFKTDQEATVVSVGAFRLPDGDCGRVHAVSEARYNTADDELTETPFITKGDRCNQGTNGQDIGTSKDQASAAEFLAKEHREQRAEETADLIAGCDSTANDVNVVFLRIRRWVGHLEYTKGSCKLFAIDEARHHALIVAEERETHDGGDGDAHPERPPFQAAGRCPHVDSMRTKNETTKSIEEKRKEERESG